MLVHGGKNSNFVLKTFGSKELYTGKTGGSRSYTHALVKVNPKDKSETVELDPIELKPGKTVLGTVEDEEGNPVDFFAYSTNKIFPTAFNWRPLVNKSFDGKLKLEGLDDRTHTVHLIDTDNGLGATLKVKAGDRPKVVMKPLLPAKVTFVDKKTGEPLKGHHSLYFLQMIAPVDTEGNEDQRFASLKKEKVFPANMDRRRHPMDLKSNDQGECTIPALIPGATYSVVSYENDKEVVLKTFIASTETTDLGKIETSKFEPLNAEVHYPVKLHRTGSTMSKQTAETLNKDWRPWSPSGDEPWDGRRAAHLHRRAGFAGTWKEIQRDVTDGHQAAIKRFLEGKAYETAVPEDIESLSEILGKAAAASENPSRLQAWWLYQMIFSPDPLGERMKLDVASSLRNQQYESERYCCDVSAESTFPKVWSWRVWGTFFASAARSGDFDLPRCGLQSRRPPE